MTQALGAAPRDCYFWGAHTGAELDLLWARGRRRWGFEFKRTTAPRVTPSLRSAIEALRLQKAFVIHAGDQTFPLDKRVTAVAAVFALAKGAHSKAPVQTQFGWHVIKVEDIRKTAPPPLESQRQQILGQLLREKFEAVMTDLRSNTSVEMVGQDAAAE